MNGCQVNISHLNKKYVSLRTGVVHPQIGIVSTSLLVVTMAHKPKISSQFQQTFFTSCNTATVLFNEHKNKQKGPISISPIF